MEYEDLKLDNNLCNYYIDLANRNLEDEDFKYLEKEEIKQISELLRLRDVIYEFNLISGYRDRIIGEINSFLNSFYEKEDKLKKINYSIGKEVVIEFLYNENVFTKKGTLLNYESNDEYDSKYYFVLVCFEEVLKLSFYNIKSIKNTSESIF